MQPAIDPWHDSPESPILDHPETVQSAPRWNAATRILFRFTFAYLLLYNFPFPLSYVPYLDVTAVWTQNLWNALVPWVGTHLFHADTSTLPNGSGDTTYNYVQVFCYLVIALAATAVWSILDRKRTHYARLHEWTRIYTRFALAAAMISYGAYKIVKSQFPAPSIDRLLQPYGDASPMGLLWTFMGVSTPYTVFGGAMEMLGGLLLTVRRTALLGALVSFGVLLNIVMLNFCYDVPVKLYSSHLLLMAAFLIAPDVRRLVDVFVLNRRAAPVPMQPVFRRAWLHHGTVVLRTLLVLAFATFMVKSSADNVRTYFTSNPKWPLRGVWSVDEFLVDGQARPPLVTDTGRWRRVVFDLPSTMAVQLMSDSRLRYNILTQERGVLHLGKRDDLKWKTEVAWRKPSPDRLEIEGPIDGHKLFVKLHREPVPKFLLMTRGFHWINERPFNR
jgi:hypothetical protein